MTHHYSMEIVWSDIDQLFLVSLPEFADDVQTFRSYGKTYEEAVRNGVEALESLVEFYQSENMPLPKPRMLEIA